MHNILPLIPEPANYLPLDGSLAWAPVDGALWSAATDVAAATAIGIRFHEAPDLVADAYRIHITADGIGVDASGPGGRRNALATLRQLAWVSPETDEPTGARLLPCARIEDAPAFAWRGMHLDVARHFMPVEFVCRLLDRMAELKLNVFHWHLTDDQGWRIEIERYPRLTGLGSVRPRTRAGHQNDSDGWHETPHSGFYTQADIRQVVRHATDRGITVVPEIDLPGHVQALLAAYPELGNFPDDPPGVLCEWGISKHILNANPDTLGFMLGVLEEVLDLFPGQYIHIGGDEVPTDEWRENPAAAARAQVLGLADVERLYGWYVCEVGNWLEARGRSLIGWDEIHTGNLMPSATVMAWRGVENGVAAANDGHDVVMAPMPFTYFDWCQHPDPEEPLSIGHLLTLETAYRFSPVPAEGLSSEARGRILGGQCQLWTEYMKTPDRVEYMAFPRAFAFAEAVWTSPTSRNYAAFVERLRPHLAWLDVTHTNYRRLDG